MERTTPCRIGILGHHDTHNFGDVLLAELCADAIQEGGGQSEFLFGCGNMSESGLRRKIKGLAESTKCDGLVLGGGGYLEAPGRYLVSNLLPLTAVATLFRLRGLPVGIFGAGSGASNRSLARLLVRQLCALSSPIIVRDKQTLESLAGMKGSEDIKLAVDLAHVVRLKGRYRSQLSQPLGAEPKSLLLHFDSLFLLEGVHPAPQYMRAALTNLQLPKGWQIKLVFDYLRDAALFENLRESFGVEVVAPTNVSDLLHEVSRASAVVSGKFHVALVAMACAKPVVGISPHPKVTDLFESFGLQRQHLPRLESEQDAATILNAGFEAVWTDDNELARVEAATKASQLYDAIAEFARRCNRRH